MPAPLTLAGTRFGRLLVLDAAPRTPSGERTWRVRCDCGTEEVYPQRRLTQDHARSAAARACTQCLAPACQVCGTPIETGSRARRTCDDPACDQARAREIALSYYRRHASDAGWRATRAAAVQSRREHAIAADPTYLARETARKRQWLHADPDRRENARRQARHHYARNRDAILARRAARLDRLDADALTRWLDRTRAYGRAYRARWRQALQDDPAGHRAYLDLMAEYRRRQQLQRLLRDSHRLIERIAE